MTSLDESPLGKTVVAPVGCDPSILYAIARDASGPRPDAPFVGEDIWNAWELTWLGTHGNPCVATAQLRVPADSPQLIESKSLKLYLQGYGQERFADAEAVRTRIARDLSATAGADVAVTLFALADAPMCATLHGDLIDHLPVAIDHYGPPQPDVLSADARVPVGEVLRSDLFKSNCPVTGQPDFASVQIAYRGPRIERAGLLRYLVSFREHREFHEACVERIFADVLRRCAPTQLSVYARYTRRGGLDINPFRATPGTPMPENTRVVRQ
ncbi:MAG: NADPH-dependent 7-cyano-7-deazaguanine reductase QueF [Proteobacteria bacterium]|nr:NADPH-dependent 7-cyano-7-deazaguanine reductase QueF [Pseudomonadota bacterium]